MGGNALGRRILSRTMRHVLGVVCGCTSRHTPRRFAVRGSRRRTHHVTRRSVILLGGTSRVLPLGASRGMTFMNNFTGGPHFRNNKDSRVGYFGVAGTLRTIPTSTRIVCTRKFPTSGSLCSRGLTTRTLRTTGTTSGIIVFTKLPSDFRSRKCSHSRVELPRYRGHLVTRVLRIRPGAIVILRGNSPIRVP